MKREESIKRMKIIMDKEKLYENNIAPNLLAELINDIYNDFENRICKNCKWFNKVGLVGYSCSNKKNKEMFGMSIIWINKDFVCNLFERRIT